MTGKKTVAPKTQVKSKDTKETETVKKVEVVVEEKKVTAETVVEQTAGSKKTKQTKTVAPKEAEKTVAPKEAEKVAEKAPVVKKVAKAKEAKDVKETPKEAEKAPETKEAKKVVKTVKVKKAKTVKKTTVKKVAPKKQTAGGEGEEGEKRTRYFKYVYEGDTSGRFSGNKPKQAANKALTSIFKTLQKKGEKVLGRSISFTIKECTRGSKHKEYKYEGKREQLATPMKVNIKSENGVKTIEYRFNNRVQKVKQEAKTV
jgi:hypothetical protein